MLRRVRRDAQLSRFVSDIAASQAGSETSGASLSQTLSGIKSLRFQFRQALVAFNVVVGKPRNCGRDATRKFRVLRGRAG